MPKRSKTAGIRCPKCESRNLKVVKTLPLDDAKERILVCQQDTCGHRFMTRELIIGDTYSRNSSTYSQSSWDSLERAFRGV